MKRNLVSHKPVYAFDICGELIAEFKDRNAFLESAFYNKWFGHVVKGTGAILRFSTKRKQQCGYGKIFLTNDKNFRVSYTLGESNHNPLRITKSITAEIGYFTIEYYDTAFKVEYERYQHYDRALDAVRDIYMGRIVFDKYVNCDANLCIRKTNDILILHEAFLAINNHYELHN